MASAIDQLSELERASLHKSFADFERSVLQDNIILCDGKSGVLLAFSGGMVIFCVDAFVGSREHGAGLLWLSWVKPGLFLVAAAGFLLSCHFSLATVLPRFRRGQDDNVFWEAPVFDLSMDLYVERMQTLDGETEYRDMLRHLHVLARICRSKFKYFRLAMRIAQAAFVVLVLAELARIVV